MIRIIRPGYPNLPDPGYVATCPECGCLFSANRSDMENRVWPRQGWCVDCPTCGQQVYDLKRENY